MKYHVQNVAKIRLNVTMALEVIERITRGVMCTKPFSASRVSTPPLNAAEQSITYAFVTA